jgi:phosphoglycolate phosphatase-like HAD superfamily hydrolase
MENARRKIDSGLYDDAVARLYRATELISQIMLKKIGYDDPIYVDENSMSERDLKIVEKFKHFAEKKDGKYVIKIGLKNKIELLAEFGIDLAIKMRDDKKLWNSIKVRNESILAHGLKPVSKDEAVEFFEILQEYVKDVYGKNYSKDSKKVVFPKMGWEYGD